MSCDLLPSDRPGPHYQGDVRDILYLGWDLMIAHPDCTYLTNSAEWCYKDDPGKTMRPGVLFGSARRQAREEALAFVEELMDAPIDKIAIENPVGQIGTRIDARTYGFSHQKASQYIQPHEYGHDASKKTGLWLKNLEPIRATHHIEPRLVEYPPGSGKIVKRWDNQTDSGQNRLPPSADRWKLRAETYLGWANAMADTWG